MVSTRAWSRIHWAGWMLRYWVLDKHRRAIALSVSYASGMASTATALAIAWLLTRPPTLVNGVPMARADGGISLIWLVVVMLVSAVISYAMRPKPEPAKPVEGKQPEVKDGKAARRVYGTVWTDDSAILAWKNLHPEPIRKKGGKK